MNQNCLESYLLKATELTLQGHSNAIEELLTEIRRLGQEVEVNSAYSAFFAGEEAFYTGHYETALRFYLKAAEIPHFQFFCFRASAYLFHSLAHLDKACLFAEKALNIIVDDPMTRRLIETMQPIAVAQSPGVGRQGWQVLKHIFQPSSSADELFADEFKKLHPHPSMESPMNTESDIFSSPHVRDVSTALSLTERLYPEQQPQQPYVEKREKSSQSALAELQRLAQNAPLGLPKGNPEEALEQTIKSFQISHAHKMQHYSEIAARGVQRPDDVLFYLHGWKEKNEVSLGNYLTEEARKSSGGFFLRWNGKGIAVNPGSSFLENLHAQGLTVRDIDSVIVTSDVSESYADVKEIYDLNTQLNKSGQELHLIHYYFHLKAFQELSRILKPHFKQERNTLHSLEIFMDSPDVEKIDLAEGITLHYFLAGSKGGAALSSETKTSERQDRSMPSLGIRLECKSPSDEPIQAKKALKIGYIAHSAWNPLLAYHLGSCDLLIVGFGNTGTSDYNKISYNNDSLGYYGTLTLLEEIAPRLLLLGEFSGREGDIRLEAVQKLRHDYALNVGPSTHQTPTVLPADKHLQICLKTLQVRCATSDEWIDAPEIKTFKTRTLFAPLKYVSPWSCC